MLEQAARRRRADRERSQLAMELAMLAWSIAAAAVILRSVLVSLGISDRVWLGEFVYGLTAPVTDIVGRIPAASTTIFGRLTLMDVTLLAIIVLFPLGVIATGGRDRR